MRTVVSMTLSPIAICSCVARRAPVIDMSMTGARLATHEQIAIGERVMLTTVRMGVRSGVVVRFADGELGVRFTDDISEAHEARMAAV